VIFLIEYSRGEGRIVTYREFDATQRRSAHEARLELELDLNRNGLDHEVVLLEAPTKAHIQRSHRRYFEDLDSLLRLDLPPNIDVDR
jgi:hypothetical protein